MKLDIDYYHEVIKSESDIDKVKTALQSLIQDFANYVIEKKHSEVKEKTSPFSDGLDGLFIRMLDLSDQFEEFCCKEKDEFTRGQFDGKSLAYSDCARLISELIKEAV